MTPAARWLIQIMNVGRDAHTQTLTQSEEVLASIRAEHILLNPLVFSTQEVNRPLLQIRVRQLATPEAISNRSVQEKSGNSIFLCNDDTDHSR